MVYEALLDLRPAFLTLDTLLRIPRHSFIELCSTSQTYPESYVHAVSAICYHFISLFPSALSSLQLLPLDSG